MKVLFVFVIIVPLVLASEEEGYCLRDTTEACHGEIVEDDFDLANCNASYSGFAKSIKYIQRLTNLHLIKSYDYLLVAANFGTFVKNRPGFEKLFRHLSDTAWMNSIDLMKYMGKRGGIHDFNEYQADEIPLKVREINEIIGLAYSLDTEKYLAEQTNNLHKRYSSILHPSRYDAEVSSYLEEKFLVHQAERVRRLSGYMNDFKKISSDETDVSLSTFLFDEYLQKQ